MIGEEVKDFVAIIFNEYFKFIREEQNFRKVAKLLYVFLTTSDEVKIYVQSNSSDNCVHHYNVEIWIFLIQNYNWLKLNQWLKKKNQKNCLSEFKKFKIQTKLVLDYNKINDFKIFHSNAKLTVSDSDIYEAFKSMHQNIMTKMKNYASEDCIVWM